MERRLYFLLGDCLANVVTGGLAAWGGVAVAGSDWHMLPAMLVGMVVGMGISFFSQFPFLIYFGAMEVMLPVMLTGMVAGMAGSMAVVMVPEGEAVVLLETMLLGAGLGLAVVVYTYGLNALVRGETVHHE